MGDLQELFDRLKAQSSDAPAQSQSSMQSSIWTQSQQQTYQQPAVSSPIFSPAPQTPNPVHSSNVISPVNPSSAVGTPGPDQNRTNNLLNLLKFNNQGSQAGPMANLQNVGGLRSSSMTAGGNDTSQPRPLSAQDLMASFQRKQPSPNVSASPTTAAGAEKPETTSRPSSDSKDFLLNLLTKPKESTPLATEKQTESTKPADTKEDEASIDRLSQTFAEASIKPSSEPQQPPRESTPVRQFGTVDAENTPFEAPQPTKGSLFNYVNPFDQLHSSSPLNRSPRPEGSTEPKKFEILKHDREVSSAPNGQSAVPAAKHRKVTSDEASPAPSPAPAEPEKAKSVSQALEGVGETVDKEVTQALAQADAHAKDSATTKTAPAETGDNTADDGTQIKKEIAAEDEIESSWESAEDEVAEKTEDFKVEVYNFPMKPFVSIHIKSIDAPRPIRQQNLIKIAQLKKEFDQIDRCLVTASQSHILYAQVATKKDNGGFRIIRQDNGVHKQVFRSSGERVFNVQLCNSPAPGNDIEAVLGTGVNGSIFWTSLAKSRGELFADDDIEIQGFIMPAVPTPEEQTSGTQVKTRAKMSSRHPEYFAVARSKHIHIIAPETVKSKAYLNAKTRKVNSEKYLAEHGLRIMTLKACKDFCFSEDDSMIVSLDKSGRFKFWDIKDLTSRASDITEGKHEPVELHEPIWQLNTATSGSKPDEKPSVSSIMFLDKDRPMSRGIALRYMLIGFKQNHILQLWDLGLGKAVQEIRLPHEKDSDGICSLTYHAKSGIIAIGHPTRNSVYFIHLSAPRYSISHMDQAKYINLLARNDPALPRPESTAIMSGLREFSFARVGQLRSLDMLAQPIENASDPDSEDATLFELYVMHSKGVVGVSIKRKDLGWDKDSKMVKPVDAVQAGIIEVKELIPLQKLPAPSESSNTDVPAKQPAKSAVAKKHEPAKPSTSSTKTEIIKRETAASPTPAGNAVPSRAEASKQVPEAPVPAQQTATNPPLITAESYAIAAQRAKSPSHGKAAQDAAISVPKSVSSPADTAPAPQVSSNDDLQTRLNKQFDALYSRIDADKRVQDAAGSAKQDAMLRLVSSTLTENVEKSLNRIVTENMTKEIVPSVTNSINKTVEKKLSDMLPQQLNSHVPKELKAALPHAIQQALKDPQVHNTIANQVAQKVQQQVSHLLQQSMPNIATQATQKMISDLEKRTTQQLQEAETRHKEDNAKIEELSNLVQGLSQMIQNMSESQVAFQEQILKMQRPSSRGAAPQESSRDDAASAASAPDPQKAAEDQEVDRITDLLMRGEYDSATIAWLQSARQGELFDKIFVRVNPQYLRKVRPLVALSVSAAITASLETHLPQRLEWLGTILETIDLKDEDMKEVAPKIMDVLSQRLQGAYMNASEANASDPNLKRISALNRQVVEIRRLSG